jgi:hypothetical protein
MTYAVEAFLLTFYPVAILYFSNNFRLFTPLMSAILYFFHHKRPLLPPYRPKGPFLVDFDGGNPI